VLLLVTVLLVLAGLVLLIVGFIQDTLSLIYLSIGCAAVAGVALIVFSRLSRRRALRLATDGPSIALRGGALDDRERRGAEPVPAGRTDWVRPARSGDVATAEPEWPPAPATSSAPSTEEVETVDVAAVGAADRSDVRGEPTWSPPTATGAPTDNLGGREPVPAEAGDGDPYPVDDGYDDEREDFDAWGDEVVFPIEEYDELRVGEIVPLLPELEPDELEEVRDRESSGKNRSTIVLRIDELLGRTPPAPAVRSAAAPAPAPSRGAVSPAAKKPAGAAKRPGAKAATPAAPAPARAVASPSESTRGKRAAAKATPAPVPAKRAAATRGPAEKARASTNAAPKRAAAETTVPSRRATTKAGPPPAPSTTPRTTAEIATAPTPGKRAAGKAAAPAASPKRAASKAAAAPAPAKRATGKSAAPATTKRGAAKADPAATEQVAKKSRGG
jgi:hypothetical protein